MIRSFGDKRTERFAAGERVPAFEAVLRSAQKALVRLHAARSLNDFRPGDHLELLHGDRAGQHSIRINKQFRICFVWLDGDAYDVVIVDYH